MRTNHIPLLFATFALFGACGDNETPLPTAGDYATADTTTAEGNDPGQPSFNCWPNLDGLVESTEIEPVTGQPVSYRVNPANETRQVDLAGFIGSDGRRVWDWTSSTSADLEVQIEATVLGEQWFAPFFETAEFTTPFDLEGTTMGIYRHDEGGLWLHGLASTDEDPPEGRTLFVYDNPILLYQLPLEVGEEWVTTGQLTGAEFRGLPYAGKDVYEVSVEAAGELRLPELLFEQALLVRIKATIQPAVGTSVSTQQASFVVECFGEVARATSLPDETDENFSTAQEVRRLAL